MASWHPLPWVVSISRWMSRCGNLWSLIRVGLGWIAGHHNVIIVEMGVKRVKSSWDAKTAGYKEARFATTHERMQAKEAVAMLSRNHMW